MKITRHARTVTKIHKEKKKTQGTQENTIEETQKKTTGSKGFGNGSLKNPALN